MKNIRISIDAPILPTNSGLTHSATSYQIAKFPDFNNPEFIIKESLLDDVNLLEYRTELEIDNEDTIYVRTKYHFIDANDVEKQSNWSRITPINGNQKGFKLSDVIINTPIISYEIISNNIKVTTSEMKMYVGSGSHISTSWRITDSDGHIVYDRKEDKDNLTNIVINNILKDGKSYVIEAKHHNSTYNESNYGRKLLMNYNTDYNLYDLELLGDITKDRKQYFKLKLYTTNFLNMDIVVRDISGTVIKSLYNTSTLVNYITLDNMNLYSSYEIFVRIKLTDGNITSYKKVYSNILNKNMLVKHNPFIEYLNKYDYTNDYLTNGISASSAREMYDGKILSTDYLTNTISLYKFENTSLIKLKEVISLGSELTIDYVNILPLHNGDIVINYSTTDSQNYNKSIFKKYSYDPIKLILTEVNSITRNNELYSTSLNNSAVVSDEDYIYYIPSTEVVGDVKVNLSLYRLRVGSFVFEKVTDLPFNAIRNVSIFRDNNNGIYVVGGSYEDKYTAENELYWTRDNNSIYKLNTSNSTLEEITALPTEYSTSIYCMHSFLRRDGKIVIFNSVHNGESLGNHDVLIYDTESNNFEIGNIDNNLNIPFRNNIILLNGNIVRISSLPNDPQKSFTYICNTKTLSDLNIVNDTIELITDLVVNDGEIINIESAYNYDTITIIGTGILKWVDKESVREFTSSDLIVTRNTVMTQAEFDAGNYSNVFVLDGVTFVVEN